MAELALVSFGALTLLKEGTQDRLRINTCREHRRFVQDCLSVSGTKAKILWPFVFMFVERLSQTFGDFLSSDDRFKQLVEFIQLLLLVDLLSGLISLALSRPNKHTDIFKKELFQRHGTADIKDEGIGEKSRSMEKSVFESEKYGGMEEK